MSTKQFSNYESLLTFTRASKGHALRPVSYGDELVDSGTFDDASALDDWSVEGVVSTTLSIDNERLKIDASTIFDGAVQTLTTVVGKVYEIKVDYELGTSTRAGLRLFGTSTTQVTAASGTITLIEVATITNPQLKLTSGSSTGTLFFDNISVKEVLFDQPDGTLTLFEHPENVPRVEYDADGNRLGLLVEEQRVNLERYSDFSSDWTSLDSTEVQNAVAPDGTETAFTVTRDSTSYGGFFFYNAGTNISVTSGSTYSVSIYLKQGEMGSVSSFSLKPDNSGVGGTVVSGSVVITPQADGSFSLSGDFDASSQNVGNGWYRISFSFTATATGTAQYGLVSSGSSNFPINSSVLVWGAQVEEGSFPTSYIKTTGSTATRSADVASIPVADFGYNQSAQSLLWEGSFLSDVAETDYLYNINNNSGSPTNVADSIRAFKFGDGDLNYRVSVSSLSSVNSEFTGVTENLFKVAYALDSSSYSTTRDGGAIAEDTSVAIPTGLTTLHIGPDFSGHIKSIKYYPRRLSNAQLQDLTS